MNTEVFYKDYCVYTLWHKKYMRITDTGLKENELLF